MNYELKEPFILQLFME